MAHDVKLGLWLTTAPVAASASVTPIDTTASGYDLESLPLQTPIGDPLTEHVVETMTVRITGTSKADLRTKLSAVYDFADQVRRYWRGQNPYFGRVTLQVENTGNNYWSLLYNVQVSHDNILGATLANYQAVVTITYERDGFWELVSATGTALTLTNSNGTGTALNIANCNDGTGTAPNKLANYVDIDTSDVDGDVPTPLFVVVENTENLVTGNRRIYAGGINASGSTVLPTLFFEGEDATGATSTADATCSKSAKGRLALASGPEAQLLSWEITSPSRYLSMWYKVIARFASVTGLSNINFRWKITSGTTVVWEGPKFRLEDATTLIQEMGEVPLPPLERWMGYVYLQLFGEQTTGASITLDVDYIQLMAAQTALKLIGIVPQEYGDVIFAPYYGDVHPTTLRVQTLVGSCYDWYVLWNPMIMANPGQYYRIHFVIQSETAGTAEKDRNSTINVYYRPRYRSIGE